MRSTFTLLFICFLLFIDSQACEIEQTHQGCKIQGGRCTCNYGCKSEYRYSTLQECKKAFKERASNICDRMPCLNSGSCIQISLDPRFKCRCEGTGFYGTRCERACPPIGAGRKIPYECVVI